MGAVASCSGMNLDGVGNPGFLSNMGGRNAQPKGVEEAHAGGSSGSRNQVRLCPTILVRVDKACTNFAGFPQGDTGKHTPESQKWQRLLQVDVDARGESYLNSEILVRISVSALQSPKVPL